MELVFINKILTVLANGFGILLAGLIYFANRRSKVNLFFSLSIILIVFWLNFGYLAFSSTQGAYALLWLRLNFATVSLFFIPFYFFALYFPKKIQSYPIFNKLVLLVFIILGYLSIFTDFFIKDLWLKGGEVKVLFGEGIFLFYGTISLFTFLIIYILVRKYFFLSKEEKLKTQYFLVGAGIFALAQLIFCVFLPLLGSFKYLQTFGTSSAIVAGGLIGFAILKKKLFEVKVILTELYVFFLSILLLLDFAFTQQSSLRLLKGIVIITFLLFGYLLIKSTLGEIREKERFKKLNQKLEEKVKERTRQLEEAKTVLEIKVRARTRQLEEEKLLLEKKVKERTRELQKRVDQLEKFYRITVGRELKMRELKRKIKELEKKLKSKED